MTWPDLIWPDLHWAHQTNNLMAQLLIFGSVSNQTESPAAQGLVTRTER